MLKTKLIKLSQKAVVSLFLSFSAVSSVLAQEASYTTIEPTLNAQCVDSPPLGDGFGWNGRCGCELEPEWSEFGHTVALSGNTLVIAAKDTPENCPGSAATFSIYEKSSFGSWVKETELNLDENGSIRSLDFFDEKLLVDAGSQRRIFEKVEGQWQLVSTLEGDMNQAPGQFVRTSRPTNDLLEYTFGDRDINGNETIQSHIQTETNSLRIERYDDIAVASSDRDQAIFLSENSAGHWQVDQQVSLVNFARGSMVLEDSILIVDTRDNIQSWARESDGVWAKTEQFTSGIPNSYFWLPIIPFESDDRLLITAPGHFRTYALNHENKLVETGRLEVPLSEWGRYWIDTHAPSFYKQDMNTRTAFDGAHLLAGNSRDNVAYVIDVTADGTFGATVNNEPTEGMCDYTNADIYDGWGWNAATGQSCAPEQPQQPQQEEQNSGCDYSQADNYGGWGWNSTTLMSCPPITTSSVCEDTAPVGDGWGWDGVASCRVISNSSIPSSNTECVDTIPIGDGWGWNGSASCRVDSVSNPASSCVDTPPAGDGWGWDGTGSCRVSSN